MARKKKHEEHANHEAWAIPYGDLVTLLFALFTVMYAISSVNEGKLRVLSDSLIAAFRGVPTTTQPIPIGHAATGKGGTKPLVGIRPTALLTLPHPQEAQAAVPGSNQAAAGAGAGALAHLQRQVENALKTLIDQKLVTVRRESLWLEVEINTDILFPSGSDAFSPAALPILKTLAHALKPLPNPIRVEGHTDDRPIHTAQFPSNWELSAGRAASVVHEFTRDGVDPMRLEIVGFGQYHPVASNATAAGRNANRRVSILILEDSGRAVAGLSPRERDVMLWNTVTPNEAAPADRAGAVNRLPEKVSPAPPHAPANAGGGPR